MQKIYVSLKKETRYHKGVHSTLIVVLGFITVVFFSLFIRSSFNIAREELIEKLGKEREVFQLNEKLKVELAGITRGQIYRIEGEGKTWPEEAERGRGSGIEK